MIKLVRESGNKAKRVTVTDSLNNLISRFEVKILERPRERIFKTTCMRSFVRQLNLYGFHKVQLDKDANFSYLNEMDKESWPETVFAHPYFKRAKQELLGKYFLVFILLKIIHMYNHGQKDMGIGRI